ncbi:cytochrome P450 2S1 isoform X2 [Talpa occidentalis]|uniref:cytochrome P450 2S1 isoform X2 n=1 Tax=Talpa occidentalis TaxID=50954 RepID=UPI0023F8C144|nr:cytochrome P450 2S1 isoform X2 [Talpa occidentalis]
MGKREGEEMIQAEVRCLLEAFRGTKGQPFDPSLLLAQATSNMVCSLIFGLRFPYKDKEFQAMVQAAGGVLLGISSLWGQAYEMFSQLLQHLPSLHADFLGHVGTLAAFAVQQVERHRKNLDTSGPARDLVDAFLLKMTQEKQDANTEFTDKNLLMNVIYLLFAGTMTVSATTRYTLLLLMKYPQVQERVREELTRELGARQVPSLADRARLPYTDAVLHEAQRLLALVPMGIPRALTKTTCFRGYTLPKGTEVFPLLGSVLHDPEVFKRPEEFNPDRFLDANGRFKKEEAFLPFSLAKLRKLMGKMREQSLCFSRPQFTTAIADYPPGLPAFISSGISRLCAGNAQWRPSCSERPVPHLPEPSDQPAGGDRRDKHIITPINLPWLGATKAKDSEQDLDETGRGQTVMQWRVCD